MSNWVEVDGVSAPMKELSLLLRCHLLADKKLTAGVTDSGSLSIDITDDRFKPALSSLRLTRR